MFKIGQKVRITTKHSKRMDGRSAEQSEMIRNYGGTIMTVSSIKHIGFPDFLYYLMEEDKYCWSWYPEMIMTDSILKSPKLPNI